MITYADRAEEAKDRRQAQIRHLLLCECLWPLTVYRNGSGHDDTCPVHLAYLERRSNG